MVKRFHCPITAIASMSEYKIIVFALASGQIGLVSSVDGKEILMQKVEINGVSSVITSLSCNNSRIAAGTIDGLVLVYEIV